MSNAANKETTMQAMDYSYLNPTKQEITSAINSRMAAQSTPEAIVVQINAAIGKLTTSEWIELHYAKTVLAKDINYLVQTAMIRAKGHK